MDRIYVAEPHLGGNEKKYVLDCLESNWISSNGKYITEFERAFADFCGVKHAVATNNGTTALHLSMVALGLKADDEVIIPDVTYIATANAVHYCGATPVLVDVTEGTLNIDPAAIERAITERTKGIIAVHLYGHPADMIAINVIAKKYNLWVVEDAAEAHGAEVQGTRVGGLGTCAIFSFYGNKIITTGEGGMVTTNDDELSERLRLFRGQGMDLTRRYWFPVVGYNYRMTNIEAALGLAQLEKIEEFIAYRALLASWYTEALLPLVARIELPVQANWATQVYWLYNIFLKDADAATRDAVMVKLDELGIETRPVFYPIHILPPYIESRDYPIANSWSQRGINLPTHLGVTKDDVQRIVRCLTAALE